MKKIKVSSIKMECNAQVINVDAHLVAQAIRAKEKMEQITQFRIQTADGPMLTMDYMLDQMGCTEFNKKIDYIEAFLNALAEAFLEDDEPQE